MILNAATGDTLGRLDTTGFYTWSGSKAFFKIGVSDDGRIYAANQVAKVGLTTGNGPVRIYTWANESAKPTVAFSDSVKGPQLGDALAVAGSGTSTFVYLGGNGTASPVQIFRRSNDSLLVFYKTLTVSPASNGAQAITPMTAGFGPFWIKKNGKVGIQFDTTGAPIDTVPSATLAITATSARFYQIYGRSYIFGYDGNVNPSTARIIDVTNGFTSTGAYIAAYTPSLGIHTNSSTFGEALFNPVDSSMIVLSTDNSIGAYKTMKSNATAKSFTRSPYVALAGANDTVTANVVNLQKAASVKFRYMSAPDTVGTLTPMTLTSGDSLNGVWTSIIPASLNVNSARISYNFDITDVTGNEVIIPGPAGYFAGVSKMSLSTTRAIDTTTGINLWIGYGLRVTGVDVMEDSVIGVLGSYTSIMLQDDQGGMDFYDYGATPYRIVRGHSYTIAGQIYQYGGAVEIESQLYNGHLDVTDNGPATLPAPKLLTLHDLTWSGQGEQVENSLVQVRHVRLTSSSAGWPAAGAGGTNLTITDNGVDSLTFRIPTGSTANGAATPRQPFTLTGIASQFVSAAPFKSGYEIFLRNLDDIAPEINVSLKDTTKGVVGSDVTIAATTDSLTGLNVLSYQFAASFDSTALKFKSGTVVGTISSGFTFAATPQNGGRVNITASGAQALKNSGSLFTLTFTVLKAGNASIALTGQFNGGNPVALVTGGVVSGGVLVEVEPNDTTTTATPLAFGSPANGMLSRASGDPDYFSFTAPVGHLLIDATDSSNTTDLRLTLFDGTGKALYDVDRNVNERLEYNVTTAGQYYIRVLGHKSGATYATGLYQLMPRIGTPTDGREPNDGPLTGFFNLVTPAGFNYSDTLNTLDPGVGVPGNDWDYFSVIATTGQIIRPLVQTKTFKSTSTLNHFQVSVYRKNAFSSALATGSSTDGSDVSLSYTVAVADTYYVLVTNTVGSEAGPNARYKLSIGSPTGVLDDVSSLPTEFALEQNYPNPFNPSTTIKFDLPKDAQVVLKVYDVLGREVRTLVNARVAAGYQQVVWDGRNELGGHVASGMYIYRITAGTFTSVKKMMMLK
ncbi:MAG TPA: T9SS type A sorting domain-containing protein [Bacteroidota bacterium]|nr:T9SS type A sorting domain-containing protein [Bacteroidota bacterium]